MIKSEEIAEEIETRFKRAEKSKTDFKVGIEYERVPISTETFGSVEYGGEDGICSLLKDFSRMEGWDYITDDGTVIGLRNDMDTITLEPGCQFELSLAPEKKISDMKSKIENFDKKLAPMLKKHNIQLLQYGISPQSTYRHIGLLPKKRYHLMANYLWGILSDVMMRETAGIQVCYDYESEEDAVKKFRIANMLSPFVTAMCANSPIRGGVDTGYKTFRSLSWLNTDNERCPFMSKKLFENKKEYKFSDYVKEVMSTPMIFIKRNQPIYINGKINFEQFMKNGYEGYEATVDDFLLHANLYFPDVRLRNFIEIRNHDCSNHGMQYSLMALYKGVLYDDDAIEAVEKVLSRFSYNQLCEVRFCVPRTALATKVGRTYVWDIAKEILKISHNSLKKHFKGEEKYLAPIEEMVSRGQTPADIILKNWNGAWNKDISKLIAYLNN